MYLGPSSIMFRFSLSVRMLNVWASKTNLHLLEVTNESSIPACMKADSVPIFKPHSLADIKTSYLLSNDASLNSTKDSITLSDTPLMEFSPYLMFLSSILKSKFERFRSGGKSFMSKTGSSCDIFAISSCAFGSNLANFKRLKKNSLG